VFLAGILFFISIFSSDSFALQRGCTDLFAITTTAKIEKIFQERFELDYVEGDCPNNIRKLIAALEIEIPIDRAQVWVIKSDRALLTSRARGGATRMALHVVLELAGTIYDFDFTNQAQPVSVDRYLLNMFRSEDLKDLTIKKIPAIEFMSRRY